MRAHMLVSALAGLSLAASAAAEPAKAPVRKAEQQTEDAATVVAAAAVSKTPDAAVAEPEAQPPARQRRGRVTSCRCGDQNPSD